jgi:hypothetical protein
MAHGVATGINLVLGSAGCQPAVRGSLLRTDFDPEVTRGKNEHSTAAASALARRSLGNAAGFMAPSRTISKLLPTPRQSALVFYYA